MKSFSGGKMLAEVDDGIGLVTFNQPEKRNAMSVDMWQGLGEILDEFTADDAVRVVVLTGQGHQAFVSGADISQFDQQRANADAQVEYDRLTSAGRAKLAAFPKPVIARIRGYCLGGGLGIATVAACGGFAAICGSSVATAATFSAVAYPEMRRFGYPQSFATGVIAAGGTLGAMLPPSTVLAVYGIITEQDIGKLFMAGIIPGLLAMTMYMITIALIGYFRPGFLPKGTSTTWHERFSGLKDIWAPVLLFVFVIGGLYGLPFLPRFTPTEAGGVGATGAFLIGVFTGRLDKDKVLASLLQATRTAAAVFTVLIGALIFGYFLTVTQTPQKVTEFLTGLGLGSYGVLAVIMLMYLVLGCLMDAMAMIILTVPIIFPVISHLGFDPIWFGVIIVMTVELGLIHPPVGMNVFVIKSVVKDVSFTTIFKGVIPFVATDIIRLIILIAFPLLATWLPQHMMGH